MTREEAIQVLNMVEAHGSLVIQAKEMAIKALEYTPAPEWILCSERLPKENGRYLVTRKCFTTFIDIMSYATNLYKVNKYEFYDKKNKGGWWTSDSEYGSFEVNDVIAWQPSPKPYKESEV